MEELNIPIYRAKKIDSDEFVMGLLSEAVQIHSMNKDLKPFLRLCINNKNGTYDVDSETLAIHFPDMIDKEDNPIFASLSEDGKGGSVIEHITLADFSNEIVKTVAKYKDVCFENCNMHKKWKSKVIGIQK